MSGNAYVGTSGSSEDFCDPTTPAIDDDSLALLLEAYSELREFHGLERCHGRASWLSEIIEDFEAITARFELSQRPK
jgi:hypothetical protein